MKYYNSVPVSFLLPLLVVLLNVNLVWKDMLSGVILHFKYTILAKTRYHIATSAVEIIILLVANCT